MRLYKLILKSILLTVCMGYVSCTRDTSFIESEIDRLEERIALIESAIAEVNDNAIAVAKLFKEGAAILGVKATETGYILSLSDGTQVNITDGISVPGIVPIIGVDAEGNWIMSYDNGNTFEIIDTPDGATPDPAVTPIIRISPDGYWQYSMNGGKNWVLMKDPKGNPVNAFDPKEVAGVKTYFTEISYTDGDEVVIMTLADGRTVTIPIVKNFSFDVVGHNDGEMIYLSETLSYKVLSTGIQEIAIQVPDGWRAVYADDILSVTAPVAGVEGEYHILVIAVSDQNYVKTIKLDFTLNPEPLDPNFCKEWNDFILNKGRNVLLDYSYAGYDHGETAPADVATLGYKVYDVTDYGAVADDGLSDREAFLAAVASAVGADYEIKDGVITFPHKEKANAVIYFPEGEFILHTKEDDVDAKSQSIIIRAGNFVIKGAGRDKTSIVMQDMMQPEDPAKLYSSPDMLQIKHFSAPASFTVPATVVEDSPAGSFSVKVSSAVSVSAGDWVCLYVNSNDSGFVAAELAPYEVNPSWDISLNGVTVIDYHQVRSVNGNVIVFNEPLMHDVDADSEWEVMSYPHYENVGVEDLTFRGYARADFVHHGSWEYDGGYKPISMTRLVNSWIRRVGFESTSEACSIINSANVSAYDITMTGTRGHAAVRSQASSRVLIAGTTDVTSDGAGNFHGVGVSRQSIGTVLWRNRWGDDSCFESHATQPRATLIDCCIGGWHRGHQGGDSELAPHHLSGLTIWNFMVTETSETGEFLWWGSEPWWKFMPPVVVGFQSDGRISFALEQTKSVSCLDQVPQPASLYEAQLERRLGTVPAWLTELKTKVL